MKGIYSFNFKSVSLLSVIFLVLVSFNSGNAASMLDDPRFDRIPQIYLDQIAQQNDFFAPALITLNDYDNFDMGTSQAEPHIAQNPRNPLWNFCAYNINTAFRTFDGGMTWTGVTPPFPGTSGDPITAYDSLGNLFYDNMKSPITGTWTIKSTDGGVTWGAGVSANVGNDKNWIAADQTAGPYGGYIYGGMTPGNFVRSTDHGATFATMFTASTQSLPGSMTAVGPNGNIQGGSVYYMTHSGANSAGVYTLYRSTDGGVTMTQMSSNQFSNYIGTEVSSRSTVQAMRTRPYPMIACDNSYGPNRGRVYLVYASNNPSGNGNKSDIFLRSSSDFGATWSAATVVNDDANSQNNFQFFPAIWCEKNTGKLYIKWYDTRRVPTSDSMDVYATYTTNGGATFAPNQRITNKTFKISLPGSVAPAYQGDYDAINGNPISSMVCWTDFRNSNYGSYTAYFPDFAMRVSNNNLSINGNSSQTIYTSIPGVKLYTNVAKFSATVTPTPAAGSISVQFIGKDSLNNFPDSLQTKISVAPNTTQGTYTVTILAQGPNGTPRHQRTITVNALVTGIGGNEVPAKYELSQNFPNPFNPTTKISYSIAKQSDVRIIVFDALGKQVSEMVKSDVPSGSYSVDFNGSRLGTGVYFYRLITNEFTDTKKMMLIK